MFVENLSSALFFYFLSRTASLFFPSFFLSISLSLSPSSICCLSSAERSVSGSEHVVMFSFLMPWVLRMSRGRYHMDGDQRRDSGPANRLHVQVLEIFCYHRASRVYSSVQGPQSGLSADAKSSLISQISLYPKISCFLPLLQSSLCQFSALPPPQCVERSQVVPATLRGGASLFSQRPEGQRKRRRKKNNKKTRINPEIPFQICEAGQCMRGVQAKI